MPSPASKPLTPKANADHLTFAEAHRRNGRLAEAVACCRAAVAQRPHNLRALHLLGLLLCDSGERAEGRRGLRAVEAGRRAGEVAGGARAWSALAGTLADGGRGEEAIAARRRAMEARPDSPALHTELLLALHYVHGDEPEVLFAEHV